MQPSRLLYRNTLRLRHVQLVAEIGNISLECTESHKNRLYLRTIRKVKGEGGGEAIFSLHDFFLPIACAGIFFRVKPSARIFFLDKY